MSRSSPGRYAVHEFAKNVFFLEAFNGKGQPLAVHAAERRRVGRRRSRRHGADRLPDVRRLRGRHLHRRRHDARAHEHARDVHVGDGPRERRDARHVLAAGRIELEGRHAALPDVRSVDVHGAESSVLHGQPDRALRLRHEHVHGAQHRRHARRLPGRRARRRIARRTSTTSRSWSQRLVREQMAVFGEFPKYEPGYYTFLLDYAPWGDGDGMEHRNSTSISNPGLSIKTPQGRQARARHDLARVLPQLERRADPAGRARAVRLHAREHHVLSVARGRLHAVLRAAAPGARGTPRRIRPSTPATPSSTAPGRSVRSAVQMSEYAPFSDAARRSTRPIATGRSSRTTPTARRSRSRSICRCARCRTASSRSTTTCACSGSASASPAVRRPDWSRKPYSLKDIREALADLTNNKTVCRTTSSTSTSKGREVPDYATLLRGVGYALRPMRPDAAWIGNAQVTEIPDGLRVGVTTRQTGEMQRDTRRVRHAALPRRRR